MLSGMPDDVTRHEQELGLQIELGHALFATKGYAAPESGEAFARARQLSQELVTVHLATPASIQSTNTIVAQRFTALAA